MSNLRIAALLICLLTAVSFAEEGLSHATAANEVNTEYCTIGTANMIDYCMGYCEKYSETSCTSATPTYSGEDWQVIDECVCTCGVDQEQITYTDVPCGDDLIIYGTPSEGDYSALGGSGCCLPAFVLGAIGFAAFRR